MKAVRSYKSIRGTGDIVMIVEIVLTFVLLAAALWALFATPPPPNFSPDLAKQIITAVIAYWLSKGVQNVKQTAQKAKSLRP